MIGMGTSNGFGQGFGGGMGCVLGVLVGLLFLVILACGGCGTVADRFFRNLVPTDTPASAKPR